MKKPRRNHAPAFKARMALEVLRGEKTGVERLARVPFWSSGRWRMCDRVQ